jgi:hypothetical protein
MAGPRGKLVPFQGDDHLECGCPVRTAALELWLTKATADELDEAEPQDKRGKFTTGILKVIEAGIHEVSGHSVETLLQDKGKRLEFTAGWALEQLANYHAAEKNHQSGLKRVSENFREVMRKIADDLMDEY